MESRQKYSADKSLVTKSLCFCLSRVLLPKERKESNLFPNTCSEKATQLFYFLFPNKTPTYCCSSLAPKNLFVFFLLLWLINQSRMMDDDDDYMYSDDDDDYCCSDPDSIGDCLDDEPTGFTQTRPSKVITKESLLVAQKDDLRRVTDLLTLSEQHARTLLIHFRWDVDNLLSVLVEKGKDRLFVEAGVRVGERQNLASLYSSSTDVTCNVCMEDVPSDEVTTMDCGHFFCNNCWTEHFIVKINEGQSKRITCMVHKCNTICDEAVIRNLVSRKDCELAERFDRFLLESYIEDNQMVKWCPSIPHCGNAIRVEDDVYCEVECSCGLQFCFSCLANVHSPCSCQMWKLWAKKCEVESETANWMCSNTKLCPKCFKPVEKNGGCNLVRCICGQYFCWLCGGATGRNHTWDSIEGHSCGRYSEDHEKKVELGKRNLYRFMHYHSRYKAHRDSFMLETKLEAKVKDKISILDRRESTYRDYSWLLNGLHRLFTSRRALFNSYPFAFYMFGDELFMDEMTIDERELKQNLFEDQQQQFEQNIERLSKLLQNAIDDFTEDGFMEMKRPIVNLSGATDRICRSMYECIENELLGSLKLSSHSIAPYRSNGVEKAIKLSTPSDTQQLIT